MAGKRKNIIKGDFKPKGKRGSGDGSRMLDCVSLGVKPYYVEQIDGKWPPYAEITATRVINRDPTMRDDKRSLKIAERMAARTIIHYAPPHSKFCSACGEWVDRLSFREDTRNRDGLHSHCNPCQARHKRRMYWLQKEALKPAA